MKLIQSATFKLTLWYLGIILLLSTLFSIALYRDSTAQLVENANHQRNAITRLPLPIQFEPRRTQFLQNLDYQLNSDLQRILLRLLALNLATLLLGGAASYALARRTLRPISDSLEAQGRFTADASHELRTPLTAMRTEIEVALRQKALSSSEARELLSSNLEEVAKLEALSSGLLRLARFEGGLDPSTLKPISARALFEHATTRFNVLQSQRALTFAIDAGSETVSGDRDSLIELFAILIDNAIKYSPTGSTIALKSEPSSHYVHLSVADQGVGISASDIPHIFERFYRADRSRSQEHIKGYGLGLSIAKRIVDLHHGDISVTSALEKGTTFRVKLPVQYAVKRNFF